MTNEEKLMDYKKIINEAKEKSNVIKGQIIGSENQLDTLIQTHNEKEITKKIDDIDKEINNLVNKIKKGLNELSALDELT